MEAERSECWSRWSRIANVGAAVFGIMTFGWIARMELGTAHAQAQATVLVIVQAQIQLAVEHLALTATDVIGCPSCPLAVTVTPSLVAQISRTGAPRITRSPDRYSRGMVGACPNRSGNSKWNGTWESWV